MNRTSVQRYRSNDVVSELASFEDLLLPAQLVQCLAAAGFTRPSPVQAAAIPIGRVGRDMIVQAKSGTGKTLVFSVLCLDKIQVDSGLPQALIVAPTRELALQSCDVINSITQHMAEPRPAAAAFVGGLPAADDAKRLRRTCHIVVGTPGRLCALAGSGSLPCGGLKQLVLDEADQLMADSFRSDVVWLHQQLPSRKQVLAFSATYTPELMASLGPLLRNPHKVLLCEETVSLEAIKQYYCLVGPPAPEEGLSTQPHTELEAKAGAPQAATERAAAAAVGGGPTDELATLDCTTGLGAASAAALQGADTSAVSTAAPVQAPESSQQQQASPSKQQQIRPECEEVQQQGQEVQQQEEQAAPGLSPQEVLLLKVDALLRLLNSTPFHQAVVFCNRKPAADWLRQRLTAAGFPAAALSADCPQPERMATMADFRAFKLRILVSTDVMARGVDLDRVNLVANLDLPPDAATYVHRVGRTGRFGSRGLAVAFVTAAELQQLLAYLASVAGGTVMPLPEQLADSCHDYQLEAEWEQQALQQLQAAPTCAPPSSPPPMTNKQLRAAQRKQQQEDEAVEEECEWEEQEEEAGSLSAAAAAGDEEDPAEDQAMWWEGDKPLWLDEWQRQAAQLPQPPPRNAVARRGASSTQQHESQPRAWGIPCAGQGHWGVPAMPGPWTYSPGHTAHPMAQQQQQYWDTGAGDGGRDGPDAEAQRRAAWAAYYVSLGWNPALLDAPPTSTTQPQPPQQPWQQQQHAWGVSSSGTYTGSMGGAYSDAVAVAGAAGSGRDAADPVARWSAWRDYYQAMGWDVGLLGEQPAPSPHQQAAAAAAAAAAVGADGGAACVVGHVSGGPGAQPSPWLEEEYAGSEWEEEEEDEGEEVELEELDGHALSLLEGLRISIPAEPGAAAAATGLPRPGPQQPPAEQASPVRGPKSSSSKAWPGTPAPAAEPPTARPGAAPPGASDHCRAGTGQGCAYMQAWATWHQAYSAWLQAYEGWRQQYVRGGA